jgi:hypothetical protein
MWPFTVLKGLKPVFYLGYIFKGFNSGIKLLTLLASKGLAFGLEPSKVGGGRDVYSTTRSIRSFLA